MKFLLPFIKMEKLSTRCKVLKLRNKGQALAEVLIGLAIGTILIGATITAVVMALHSQFEAKLHQIASTIAEQLIDDLKTVAESNWNNIYQLNKGMDYKYHTQTSGTELVVVDGIDEVEIGGTKFNSFFSVENVYRDVNGKIVEPAEGSEDPSTQKIIVEVFWKKAQQISKR